MLGFLSETLFIAAVLARTLEKQIFTWLIKKKKLKEDNLCDIPRSTVRGCICL